MGENCSVVHSILGKHLKLGKNVTIVNSIIMDYVSIDDKYDDQRGQGKIDKERTKM